MNRPLEMPMFHVVSNFGVAQVIDIDDEVVVGVFFHVCFGQGMFPILLISNVIVDVAM